MLQPDPRTLTPGVIDRYAKRAFAYGACGALAIVLHDTTGWPIVAITDSHNVYNGIAGGGSALHWTVQRPDGFLVDIDGVHNVREMIDRYCDQADNGEAAAGLSTRADAYEWYVEAQEEPIPLTLARTFVAPLLAKIGKQTNFVQEQKYA